MRPQLSPLPIDAIVPDVIAAVRASGNAVIVAEPGAGKSTRLPPALARELAGSGNSLVLLQPRRVAARSIAARIAQEQGWTLGREVGYQVRFENRTRPDTLLRVLTEGILTRRIQSDPFLEDVGCVVLDEFHERSIHTDIALALLREIQQTVRPDLKLLVMSATMDPQPVSAFLGGAPVLSASGRNFPVAVEYLPAITSAPVWERSAAAVRRAAASNAGHILVFLPGMMEIRRTQQLLGDLQAEIHVLHSAVSAEEQDRAVATSATRKIILATNIAETSITIDGVTTVIDSGQARVPLQDTRLGIDRLQLRRISRASAKQRAGRAGRTAPGTCMRLWAQQEDVGFPEHDVPEIRRIDLSSTLLPLKCYGVQDASKFHWFEAPEAAEVQRAERLLYLLGAVDDRGAVTQLGRRMAEFPVHPRLARLLCAGVDSGVTRDAVTVAALLSEREFLSRETARVHRRHHGRSDMLERLELFAEAERGGRAANEADSQSVAAIQRTRDQLMRLVKESASGQKHASKNEPLLRALLLAYPDRVTLRRANDPSRGVMVGARGVLLEESSVVRDSRLFLSLDPRDQVTKPTATTADESTVTVASAVEMEWLADHFPQLLQRRTTMRYDAERGKVLFVDQVRFIDLLLDEKITGRRSDSADVDPGACLLDHLQQQSNGVAGYVTRQEDATALLARIQFLREYMPELELPHFDADGLAEVLQQAFSGCTSFEQVNPRSIARLIEGQLSHKQRQSLEQYAPSHLVVPSGSRVAIQYPAFELVRSNSPLQPPVAAVRLQEVFGLAETPRLANGRTPVVLHLLAPNFRPVQVTTDLKSFWTNTYAEVRKELRGRYPKHPWPEDPTTALPVAVGRRRR